MIPLHMTFRTGDQRSTGINPVVANAAFGSYWNDQRSTGVNPVVAVPESHVLPLFRLGSHAPQTPPPGLPRWSDDQSRTDAPSQTPPRGLPPWGDDPPTKPVGALPSLIGWPHLAILLSLLFLPFLAAANNDRENIIILDKTAVKNLGVQSEPAMPRPFESSLFAIGRLEEIPARRSVLSSRIPGRVVDIRVFPGDRVAKGQVLARVESRQPGRPPPTIELKAMQSGLVVESHVRLGQPVTPEAELLDISDRSLLWAVAKIPEPEVTKVVPGTPARIRVPALGDRELVAVLKRYGLEADRDAGALDGIFEIQNPDGSLQPGMRVEFSIITKLRENVLSIPREAVQGDPTKRIVFVEDFELPNAFLPVPVVLGEENERFVEVLNGLFPADNVVTKGSYALSFADGSQGMSLKEALDAAHGHEHNEDGSEMTDEQRAAKAGAADGSATGGSFSDRLLGRVPTTVAVGNKPLLIYAGVVTGLALLLFQLLWNGHRKRQLETRRSGKKTVVTTPKPKPGTEA